MADAISQVTASKPSDNHNRVEIGGLDKDAGVTPLGIIVGRNSDEFYEGAGDTKKLTEIGLNLDPTQEPLASRGDDDKKIRINRGICVPMKIATLTSDANARTKYGQPVYAAFNDEVSLSQGTFANFVGWIKFHLSLTEVLIEIPPGGVEGSLAREVGNLEYGEALVYRVNALAAATTVIVANLPFKVRLIDAWAVRTEAANAGTFKVTDGTNDITDAVVQAAVDEDVDRATQIDDARHEVAAGGTLEVVATGAGNAPIVYVMVIRVP